MRFSAIILYTIILGIFFLSGCSEMPKEKITGEWYIDTYHDYVLKSNNTHVALRLYPKGLFTQYGELGYCSGSWKYNDKGHYIHLVRRNGTLPLLHEFLKILLTGPETMTVGIFYKMPFHTADREMIIQFNHHENKSDEDPYKPELQDWRIVSKVPESEIAIRRRVEGYLHFLQSVYQHAIDNRLDISNNWFPSPLHMDFGNGVRMAYANELDDWNKCFYDSAQAVKGYQVISGNIHDITLKNGVSKIERNLDCVKQMLDKIRS